MLDLCFKMFSLKANPIQPGKSQDTEINASTKWIPAEVWQRQGMSAQVVALPGGNLSIHPISITRSAALIYLQCQ